MIYKKQYGQPFDTESVVGSFLPMMETIPYLTKEPDGFSYAMEPQDILYGLGENVRGINKRGWVYESKCSDDGNHTEGKSSLYGAYNFMIVSGKDTFGFFIDYPGKVTFDCGYTDLHTLRITVAEENYDLYIIEGESLTDIVHQFRQLVGRSYIPPKWAFGNAQSRWSYMNEDEVREVVANYRANHMPLDAVVLDIDYMERYKDFTVDDEKFPNFKDYVSKKREEGIHLIPIIDAGVKKEEGYDVYEEGVENDYFCKTEDGEIFEGGVWPGIVGFPDFMQKEVRDWFGAKYDRLTDAGIDGFWNDMNEPAIFYSTKGLEKALNKAKSLEGENLDLSKFFNLKDTFLGLSNSPEDYSSIYHMIDGKPVCHDRVHNIYGANMTRAAGEHFAKKFGDGKILMFSRASYIGAHRSSGIWFGDNHSWWSHILLNLKMLPSANMCGFLYCGADLGGFNENATRDLVLRFLALGVFTPLMRNHSALGTVNQECYNFENSEDFRDVVTVRYRLIPYLYDTFKKASENNDMIFRPLAFDYPDDKMARECETQVMLGNECMICPVYEQNVSGRYVYLPEDMTFVKLSGENAETKPMEKGVHFIEVALNEVPLFIKKGKQIPLCKPAMRTSELNTEDLTYIG